MNPPVCPSSLVVGRRPPLSHYNTHLTSMDPASIIGIIAAAFQFAELIMAGAINGIKLLKSLKETPVNSVSCSMS